MRIKKVSKKAFLVLMAFVIALSANGIPASAMTKTITVEFPESQQQNRSQTVNIPGLIRVKSVSVNTGRVSYSVNGNNITVNVSDGSPSRTHTPSKTVTVKRGPQDSTSFPSSISYNDGEYSGTLYKSGSYYPDGTRIDQKTVTVTYGRQPSTNFPDTYFYNSGGYTGTLYKDGSYYQDGYQYSYKYVTRTLGPQKSTSFPSNIYVSEGGYSGYISKSGSYYVSDTETITEHRYVFHAFTLYNLYEFPLGLVLYYDGPEGYGYLETTAASCTVAPEGSPYRYSVCYVTGKGYLTKVTYYYSQDYAGYISKISGYLYNQKYTGTVSKTIQQYSQDYTGTVYAPTKRYYSYVVTLQVEAIDTTITAGVYHTDAWTEKRGIDRDDPNFLAGEAFLVEVETSRDATDVDLKVAPSIPIDVKWDKEYDGDIVRWKTVLYDPAYKDMKGSYTFSIEVSYPLDLTSKEQVTIYVSGNVHGLSNIHLTQ